MKIKTMLCMRSTTMVKNYEKKCVTYNITVTEPLLMKYESA